MLIQGFWREKILTGFYTECNDSYRASFRVIIRQNKRRFCCNFFHCWCYKWQKINISVCLNMGSLIKKNRDIFIWYMYDQFGFIISPYFQLLSIYLVKSQNIITFCLYCFAFVLFFVVDRDWWLVFVIFFSMKISTALLKSIIVMQYLPMAALFWQLIYLHKQSVRMEDELPLDNSAMNRKTTPYSDLWKVKGEH